MANIASPLPYINKREYGLIPAVRNHFFNNRLHAARNLFRKDLSCHFGCVNAIEFSNNGEWLISGGDDRRVMLWQLGHTILDHGKPVPMKATHQSNIFSLGITKDNQKIYSGGNDDIVIVHDLERRAPLEVLQHQRAVCSLSIDPFNQHVVSTAGNDGRLLLFDTRQSVHESLVISRSRKPFHGVMFHPEQTGVVVSANSRNGVALWDLRTVKQSPDDFYGKMKHKFPLIRYTGAKGNCHYNSMSVCFNASGTHILAQRRRQSPVLFDIRSADPVAEFYHQDYYNSCTMKSCCFAGEGDQFVLSGSDDFNLYMWKVPSFDVEREGSESPPSVSPHMVLYGHRSIVNQVRYNPHYCLIASSGVEKIIKIWSAVEFPKMRGTLLEEAQGSENPREIYSHEEYVSLVHHSGQYISHNYAEQSTSEDPRMMAFFDSLVQRELECLADETDSLNESSSGGGTEQGNNDSDSSDGDTLATGFMGLPKRPSRSIHRYTTRLALLSKRLTKQMRGSNVNTRRNNNSRTLGRSKAVSSNSTKGKRTPARRSRGPRRPIPRTMRITNNYTAHASNYIQGLMDPLGVARVASHSRISAPSSERTDSDDTQLRFRNSGRISRPLRRRVNMTRAAAANKRKSKFTNYRMTMNLRSNSGIAQDSSDNNNVSQFDNNFEDNAQPSTSSGYRGQTTTGLFRIAEADSDDADDADEQSASSRPISPRNINPVQNNFISIIPTPINGSRDSLGDALVEPPEPTGQSPPERRTLRRTRRNGRLSFRHSDSSETPPPRTNEPSTSTHERLSPGYSQNRFMNETNESEIGESSEESTVEAWGNPHNSHRTPEHSDSGVGTVAGSSTRNNVPVEEVSDDPTYQKMKHAMSTRSRVKKARRNYRNHMGSDSESDSNGTDN